MLDSLFNCQKLFIFEFRLKKGNANHEEYGNTILRNLGPKTVSSFFGLCTSANCIVGYRRKDLAHNSLNTNKPFLSNLDFYGPAFAFHCRSITAPVPDPCEESIKGGGECLYIGWWDTGTLDCSLASWGS
jgi:hypothetical protein